MSFVGKTAMRAALGLSVLLVSSSLVAAPAFPLELGASGRYLVDQNGSPFLIKEISAWGLAQALSDADAAAFMDAVKSKGINTLMVSAISYDQRFAGGPPNWNGIGPFNVKWDFSTYNTAYFAHLDNVLEMARSRGLLVLLVPCYLGYKGDASQGWWSELQDSHNSPAKSRVYGQFLGNRYKNAANLIWEAGGDNDGTGVLYDHMNAIIQGIKESDTHLWTGHFDGSSGTTWSTDNALYASTMDIDGLYAWVESNLGGNGPQYRSELDRYTRGKMIIQLDQSYEHDTPHASDNEDPQWMRRKNYDGLLSGCAGTSVSPGETNNQCYTFKDWRPLMSTQGMNEAQYCFDLFESRAWQDLVPDTTSAVVTAGRGTYGNTDYVCAARTSSGGTVIAYLPSSRTVTIDMTKVSGTQAKAWWYGPTSGQATAIGTYPTTGSRTFTPSSGDWALVIDDASLGLPAPGTTGAAPDGGAGGSAGTGGALGTGGSVGTGGASGSGGRTGAGGASGSSGATGSGGLARTDAGAAGKPGASGAGGTPGAAPDSSDGPGDGPEAAQDTGCGCHTSKTGDAGAALPLLLLSLGLSAVRRRDRTSMADRH
jgi:MYXO-CTERM domain-containing protein